MNRLFSMSIRAQLLLLILIVAIPAIGIIIHSGAKLTDDAIADARRETYQLVDKLTSEEQNLLSAAEQLLITLAQLPDVRNRQAARVQPILRRLHGLNAWYSNIFVADRDGNVWAQAVDAKPFSIADRRYFINARASGRFSSGEYVLSRATGKTAFNFSYPMKDERDVLFGVVNVGIKMSYFEHIVENSRLTPGTRYTLIDHRGVILGISTGSEKYSGKQYDPELFRIMKEGPEVNTFQGISSSGDTAIISYRKLLLPGEQTPYLYIQADTPLDAVLSAANKALLVNIAILTSVLSVAIAFAWLIGKRSIADRLTVLEKASQSLASGDLQVRVSELVAGGELGRLGRTFDTMAQQLAAREEALIKSEERLWLAINVSQIGIFDHDQRTETIYWSPQQRVIHGWGPDDPITLQQFINLVHPEDRERIIASVRRAHDPAGDGILDIELRIIRRDGTVRWLKERSQTFFEGEGDARRPVRTIGAVLDITDRRKVEEALRESEVRFRSIFNGTLDGIVLAEAATGKFIMGNEAMCALLGCTEEELRTLAPEDIHPADALPQMRTHLEQTARGETSILQDMPVKRKDGSIFYADIGASTVLLNGTMHFMGVFRDVTERKQASEEQHKLVSIIENSSDMIGIADLEGRLLYLNSAGLKLTGIDSFEDVRNKPVRDFHFEADYRRFEGQILPSILQTGSWTGEIAYRHFKTGAEVPVDMNGFLVRDDITGQPIALANISRDITDRKHAEEKSEKLQAQLLQAQKMEAIGQLSGGVAHDFNNILTAIIGYGSILQRKMTANDPLRINVNQILESAGRAAQLTHSLLAFSRKQVMNMKPGHLNEIIARQEQFLRRIIGEDIELKSILRGDMVIMADSGQIEQVLMNLATNARDAMPTGGHLTIETDMMEMTDAFISAHGFGEPGTYAVISATDTGIGMDEEAKQKIFEPFFTTKEVGRGTGLGMAIVYGIVKQHKGYIDINSQAGKGTTFKIYLPVHGGQVERQEKTMTASPMITGHETILVAEDDATLRTFFSNILTEHGYTVVVAENGEDAIRTFIKQKDEIQLCVLDMIMPKKSGREVYEAIQKMKPGIKVIFSSGYTADKVLQEGLPADSTFIAKPAPPQVYLNKIREVLDG